jgi:hypothetical protein
MMRDDDRTGCPRCDGPLSYEHPDAGVGHLGGLHCETQVSDAGRVCNWPGEMLDAA